MTLTREQRERYARHLSLPEIGEEGQLRLMGGRVLVVGAGGLGSPAAFYLAAAGIGTLGLMDDDVVELSNLQRQILHTSRDLGRPKIASARERLNALNPEVKIRAYAERLTTDKAAILGDYDFVLDATDSFASKFLIAGVCAAARKPYSHGSVSGFFGQVMTVLPGQTACYRCAFEQAPEEPPGPRQGPVGVVPGVIGTIQAAEAIKYVLGLGALLTGTLLVYDALESSFQRITVERNPLCPLCGSGSA